MAKAPGKIVIDITHHELAKNLAHWLHPVERYFGKHEAARRRNREKWIAKKRKPKS